MWEAAALFSSFTETGKDLLSHREDPFACAFSWHLFHVLGFGLAWFFLGGPLPDLLPLVISSLVNLVASLLFFTSLSKEEPGMAVPYLALTPLLGIPLSALLFGLWPSVVQALGLGLLLLGGLLMAKKVGFSWRMSLVAFLWAISSNLDRFGARTPWAWLFGVNLLPALVFGATSKKLSVKSLAAGLVGALGSPFYIYALGRAPPPVVVGIRRARILWTPLARYLAGKKGVALLPAVVLFLGLLMCLLG